MALVRQTSTVAVTSPGPRRGSCDALLSLVTLRGGADDRGQADRRDRPNLAAYN